MANTNLPQPDTTPDGKTTPRWMFLLWQYVRDLSSNSTDTVISGQTFSPRAIPTNPQLLGADSEIINSGRIFSPRQISQYINSNAAESAPILANQIFGD